MAISCVLIFLLLAHHVCADFGASLVFIALWVGVGSKIISTGEYGHFVAQQYIGMGEAEKIINRQNELARLKLAAIDDLAKTDPQAYKAGNFEKEERILRDAINENNNFLLSIKTGTAVQLKERTEKEMVSQSIDAAAVGFAGATSGSLKALSRARGMGPMLTQTGYDAVESAISLVKTAGDMGAGINDEMDRMNKGATGKIDVGKPDISAGDMLLYGQLTGPLGEPVDVAIAKAQAAKIVLKEDLAGKSPAEIDAALRQAVQNDLTGLQNSFNAAEEIESPVALEKTDPILQKIARIKEEQKQAMLQAEKESKRRIRELGIKTSEELIAEQITKQAKLDMEKKLKEEKELEGWKQKQALEEQLPANYTAANNTAMPAQTGCNEVCEDWYPKCKGTLTDQKPNVPYFTTKRICRNDDSCPIKKTRVLDEKYCIAEQKCYGTVVADYKSIPSGARLFKFGEGFCVEDLSKKPKCPTTLKEHKELLKKGDDILIYLMCPMYTMSDLGASG